MAAQYPGTYGIVVHDPSTHLTAARGEVDLEDETSILSSDIQAYGTGVLYRYPVGYTMTLRKCAQSL